MSTEARPPASCTGPVFALKIEEDTQLRCKDTTQRETILLYIKYLVFFSQDLSEPLKRQSKQKRLLFSSAEMFKKPLWLTL